VFDPIKTDSIIRIDTVIIKAGKIKSIDYITNCGLEKQ